MVIQHRDRNGQYWRFCIDCTTEQADAIRRALAGVRNMGRPAALSISAIMEEQAAGEIFAAVETAILRGLADTFPVQIAPEPQPRRDPTPTPQEQPKTETAPGLINPGPLRVIHNSAADDEPGPRYWWNRD